MKTKMLDFLFKFRNVAYVMGHTVPGDKSQWKVHFKRAVD